MGCGQSGRIAMPVAQDLHRLLHLSLAVQDLGQVHPGVGLLGIQPQGLAELGDGLVASD